MGRGKPVAKWLVIYVNQRSLKQRYRQRCVGIALSSLWLAMCVLQIAVFEVDALAIKSLMPGTCIIKQTNKQILKNRQKTCKAARI